MKINKYKKEKGYILLLSVLFLAVVSLTVSIFIISTGLSNSQNSFLFEKSQKALSLSEACVEIALQEIHDSVPYTGSDTISFGGDECSYIVDSQGGQDRTIESTGTVDNVVKKIFVTIDKIQPSLSVVSWEEVSDF